MCRCVCVTVQLFSTVFNCQNKPTKGCLLQSCSWNGQESLSPVITAKPECLQACRARGGGIHKVHGWKETGKEIIWKKTSKKKKQRKRNRGRKTSWCQKSSPPCFPIKRTQGKTKVLRPPQQSFSPHRLIWVLKVIYSNIRGEASKVHLADKDATADRNVVPGARLQLCILLSHRHMDGFSPSTSSTLPLLALCPPLPSKKHFPSCLLSSHPQLLVSLPPSLTSLLSSYLFSLPPTQLSPCFPPSPPPTQLPRCSVILISWPSRKPFI